MSLDVANNREFTAKKGHALRVGLGALAMLGGGVLCSELWIKPIARGLFQPAVQISTEALTSLDQLRLQPATEVAQVAEWKDVAVPELAGYQEVAVASLAPAREIRVARRRATPTHHWVAQTIRTHVAAPARNRLQVAAVAEREALQEVYRNLHRQFLVSLISDKLSPELSTQTALANLDPLPAMPARKSWIAKKAEVEAPVPTEASQVEERAPMISEFDPAPLTTQAPVAVAQASKTKQDFLSTQVAKPVIRLEAVQAPPLQVAIAEPSAAPQLTAIQANAPPTEVLPAATAARETQPGIESAESNSLSAPVFAAKANTTPPVSESRVVTTVSTPALPTHPNDYSKNTPNEPTTITPEPTSPFTEFFDPRVVIEDAYSTLLTRDHRGRGWSIVTSSSGYPTAFWVGDNEAGAPVLSKNSAEILARAANIHLNEGTAIVMGRLPRGYRVDLSSRTERVLYINEQRQITTEVDTRLERDFILFNAKPGFEVVSFASVEGQGGVAVPLLSGHATYVDLRAIEAKQVSGKVFGAETPPKPIMGAQVQVIGQEGAMAITSKDGSFSIRRVLTVRGMDLFVETRQENAFAFRYSFGSDSASDLQLYRLSDSDINLWISQLEGGVSEQSGMIMAAMPRLVSEAAGASTPLIQTLAADPVLTPEVYGIAPSGQLVPKGQVDTVSARVLGAQIPEGPTRLSFSTAGTSAPGQWSTLIPASPRVIQMVGFY